MDSVTGNKNFDTYMFLLSADWASIFLKQLLGINSTEYNIIQEAARVSVRQILSTIPDGIKDYYCSDFSEQRVNKTWSCFNEHSKKIGASELTIKKVENLITDGLSENRNEELVISVFWMILCDDKYTCELDIEMSEMDELQASIGKFEENNDIDYECIEKQSATDWDQFIVEYRDDVPTELSDFMYLHFGALAGFKCFWVEFVEKMDVKFQCKLVSWLFKEYEILTENKCILPDWLEKESNKL